VFLALLEVNENTDVEHVWLLNHQNQDYARVRQQIYINPYPTELTL
jgi:hypothetical protein